MHPQLYKHAGDFRPTTAASCTGTPFSTVDDIPNQLNLISDYSIRFRSNDYYGSMKRFVYIILSMAIRHTTDMKIGGVPLLICRMWCAQKSRWSGTVRRRSTSTRKRKRLYFTTCKL